MPLPATPNEATGYDITLNQGADFRLIVTVKQGGVACDLTGITPRAKIRPDFTAATILTMTCSIIAPATNGQVLIAATPAQIATITPPTAPAGQREIAIGFWDLELDDGALVGRFLEGNVTLSREATT